MHQPDELLRVADICQMLKLSRTTAWRLRQDETFPKPVKISQRVFGFKRSELEAWLSSRQQQA